MSYLIKYSGDGVEAAVAPGQFVYWKSGETRWVTKEVSLFYTSRPTLFEVITTDATVNSYVGDYVTGVGYPGMMAVGYVDFNTGASEDAARVTIGSRVYLEAATAVPANGVWTNGATAATSATSFAAAVNGDTRLGGAPFNALVAQGGEGVWIFANEVGGGYNVEITTDSAARITVSADEVLVLGAEPARKQICAFQHTVTTHELLAGRIEIPLPFLPDAWFIDAYSSTGLQIRFTDLVTLAEEPNRLRIDTDGGTNLANTNVLHIMAVGSE